MAETYRKSKIEKLIQNLEIKKKVAEESIQHWETRSYSADERVQSTIREKIVKIELIDEILTEIKIEFDLS